MLDEGSPKPFAVLRGETKAFEKDGLRSAVRMIVVQQILLDLSDGDDPIGKAVLGRHLKALEMLARHADHSVDRRCELHLEGRAGLVGHDDGAGCAFRDEAAFQGQGREEAHPVVVSDRRPAGSTDGLRNGLGLVNHRSSETELIRSA
jgi:hypothetical protein